MASYIPVPDPITPAWLTTILSESGFLTDGRYVMNDRINLNEPPVLAAINQDTMALGFKMASDPLTASFLRTLVASKKQGRFLELGTGTGLATAWILSGMDDRSTLITVDHDMAVTQVAQKHLGHDPRLTIKTMDGLEFLKGIQGQQFDYIFADAMSGKYERLDLALNCVKVGGFYIIDDMLPQENWPPGHAKKVEHLIATLEGLKNFSLTKMGWATGLMALVRNAPGANSLEVS
jgi:predicted O-methyltransferase YrrM